MESIKEIMTNNIILQQAIENGKANAVEEEQKVYECNICKDRGYYFNEELQRGFNCECIARKRELNRLKRAGINTERTLKDFDVNKYPDKEYMGMIKVLLESFIDDHKGKNLFLTGNTGLGKTFASEIITTELLKKSIDTFYDRSSTMLDKLMLLKGTETTEYEKQRQFLLNKEVLVIDDLGTENLSEAKLTELFNLIDERLMQNKSTVISSNLTLEDMETKYNERITSRIKGLYQILEFKGKDLRYE